MWYDTINGIPFTCVNWLWSSVNMITTPPNGILFPSNILKIISSIEYNSVETSPDFSINKTSSDYNTFNLTVLCFNLTIDNSAVRRGFENELKSKGNNQWIWPPPKCTESQSITDVDIIIRPLDITYNE